MRVRTKISHSSTCPIERSSIISTCRTGYTRSYLRHLDRCNEMLGPMLGTLHNLRYYQRLMAGMREAIAEGRFQAFRDAFYAARRDGAGG